GMMHIYSKSLPFKTRLPCANKPYRSSIMFLSLYICPDWSKIVDLRRDAKGSWQQTPHLHRTSG
ncbi:MAG: hypothetical protein ABI947_22850, partial [Chloroflexota bacterium]